MGYHVGDAPVLLSYCEALISGALKAGAVPREWTIGQEQLLGCGVHVSDLVSLFGVPVRMVPGSALHLASAFDSSAGQPTTRLHDCAASPDGSVFCIYCGAPL